jgi:predicted dehydrogenase
VPVVTPAVDIANARLRFSGGCIANVTASRVSVKRERKLRLFQPDIYIAIDLGERSVRICRRSVNEAGQPEIAWEQIDLGEADALAKEIDAFLASVRTRARPAVTGEDGCAALELAERILAVMETE